MRQDQVLNQPAVDPESQGAQASEEGQQTGSQTGEPTVYQFDLAARYQDPDNPDEVIDGNTLKTRLNLGRLASAAQSDRDKARTQLQQAVQQMQQLQEQNAQLQKQIQEREQEEATIATLKRLGYKPESEDTLQGASDWPTEESPPQLTQEQVLQQMQNLEQGIATRATEEVWGRVGELLNNERLQQQSNENVQSYIQRARRADEAGLRATMPDVPDQAISQIGDLTEAAMAAFAVGVKASENPKPEEQKIAEEAYIQSSARFAEARNLQAKAMRDQERLAADKVLQEQTEMFAPGGKAYEELQDMNQKRTLNKDEAKKLKAQFMERARQFERDRARIMSQ